MPSTDIDGTPIVVFRQERARVILEAVQRLGVVLHLSDDEIEIANIIRRELGLNGVPAPQVQVSRTDLRRLVDLVWNEATESQAVPSTEWADRMIADADITLTGDTDGS